MFQRRNLKSLSSCFFWNDVDHGVCKSYHWVYWNSIHKLIEEGGLGITSPQEIDSLNCKMYRTFEVIITVCGANILLVLIVITDSTSYVYGLNTSFSV